METCKVDGCDGQMNHPVSGFCHKHYARMRRTGSTDSTRGDRGKGTVTTYGYRSIAKNGKKTFEHVLIAEKALGKQLPKGAEVHHVNEDKLDNRPENLVICPDKAYHKLLHVRTDALEACGNANYRKCPFCKEYDDPSKMVHNKSSRYFYHSECKKEYKRNRG